MGYRSDVYIELTEKALQVAVEEYKNNPFCKDNPFTAADKIYCVPGCNCIGFFFKSIKWYTDSYSLGEPRFWEDIISKLATLAKDDSDRWAVRNQNEIVR